VTGAFQQFLFFFTASNVWSNACTTLVRDCNLFNHGARGFDVAIEDSSYRFRIVQSCGSLRALPALTSAPTYVAAPITHFISSEMINLIEML
jgi:hypothetical protein